MVNDLNLGVGKNGSMAELDFQTHDDPVLNCSGKINHSKTSVSFPVTMIGWSVICGCACLICDIFLINRIYIDLVYNI